MKIELSFDSYAELERFCKKIASQSSSVPPNKVEVGEITPTEINVNKYGFKIIMQ